MKLFDFISNRIKPIGAYHKADISLLRHAYNDLIFSSIAAIICATIILIGLYNTQSKFMLITWYGFLVVVSVARMIMAIVFKSQQDTEEYFLFWKYLFITGAIIGGLCWGWVGAFLLPTHHGFEQLLCIFILAGITAGSISTLSSVLAAVILFLITSIIPFIIQLSHFNQPLLSLALSIYLLFFIILATRSHYLIKKLFLLQFENAIMLNKLESLATHDPLTHLGNTRLFQNNLSHAIKRSERNKRIFALIYIDLDNFKSVNDMHGHDTGDRLLLIVVERIKKTLRETDPIARLGGDEFAIILEYMNNKQDAALIAKKICASIAKPIQIQHTEIKITASIGISLYPNDAQDLKKLIKAADTAMYYVKEREGNNFHFYEKKME